MRAVIRNVSLPVFMLAAVMPACQAAVIADLTSTLSATDPIQLGRISRNGVSSDWSTIKPFPGVVNPTGGYRYEVFIVNVGLSPFIQIDFDEMGGTANLLASAYLNTYNPLSMATNYLGDPGFSGDPAGIPLTFQVIVPATQNLVVLVNDTTLNGAGIGTKFNILVEGFANTQFDDVPEPASFLTVGLAICVIARVRRIGESTQRRLYRRQAAADHECQTDRATRLGGLTMREIAEQN